MINNISGFQLSRQAAWMRIAEAFLTDAAAEENPLTYAGLCNAIFRLPLGEDTQHAMIKQIEELYDDEHRRSDYLYFKEKKVHGFDGVSYSTTVCDKSPTARNARGMLALWLALDAAEEDNG